MVLFDSSLVPEYIKDNDLVNNFDISFYEINKEILVQSKKDFINDEHNEQIKLIYNELNQTDVKKKMKKIIIYFVIISILDFLKDFIFVFYYIAFPNKKMDGFPFSYAAIFDIILQFIFSYFILKIKFYKLQHFSLYLNVIIFIIILALDLVEILKNKIIQGRIYVLYPFYLIFYCLVFIFGKIVILYGFISIYKLISKSSQKPINS